MNPTTKLVLLSASAFGMLVAANVASKALYTNSKIGLDQKALLLSAAAGVGIGYLAMKYFK